MCGFKMILLLMAICYILYSKSLDRFYTGITQDSLSNRIQKHNNHSYGKHRYTAKASDWTVYLIFEAESMAHARRIELKIKKMKSAQFIRNLYAYDELKERIYLETK